MRHLVIVFLFLGGGGWYKGLKEKLVTKGKCLDLVVYA